MNLVERDGATPGLSAGAFPAREMLARRRLLGLPFRIDRMEYLGSERILYGALDGFQPKREVMASCRPTFRCRASRAASGTNLRCGKSNLRYFDRDRASGPSTPRSKPMSDDRPGSRAPSAGGIAVLRSIGTSCLGPLFIAPGDPLHRRCWSGCRSCLHCITASAPTASTIPATRFVGLKNFCEVIDERDLPAHAGQHRSSSRSCSQIIGAVAGQDAAPCCCMQDFPGRGIARALIVLPWAVPVSLATLAWLWMFDSLYSVINWTLQSRQD